EASRHRGFGASGRQSVEGGAGTPDRTRRPPLQDEEARPALVRTPQAFSGAVGYVCGASACRLREASPVTSELKFHRHAGHNSQHEIDGEDLRPETSG